MNIGLDIDGVICNFTEGVIKRAAEMGLSTHFPDHWTGINHWDISDCFKDVWATLGDDIGFWLKLNPMPYCSPLDFTPAKYITSRRIPSWVTQQWLDMYRFPKAELISVVAPLDKLEHCGGLDLFVDDHIETVRELRKIGINAVLYEAPYQRGHECGDLPKIKHLSEVTNGNWRADGTAVK